MTPEEREQLRRDLEAAGCEKLSRTVAWAHWNMPAAAIFMRELRSLLRREEPEPVTEEGLRAEGFRQDGHGYWRMDMVQHGPRKLLSYKLGRGAFFLLGWDSIDLHIESMQQLREVIKALRGLTNESEASE